MDKSFTFSPRLSNYHLAYGRDTVYSDENNSVNWICDTIGLLQPKYNVHMQDSSLSRLENPNLKA